MNNREYTNAVKAKLIELVRAELKKRKSLPSEIRLDKASVITNPAKFFESHLCIVEANEGRLKDVYAKRLSIALTSAGIDIYELKRKAEKEINKLKKDD